ncbi:pectinesterase [Salvia divinorum]|uniref:Pectinesterase n=1 Tax=Salvia divinorum TaxID=28513 RepID=A0ABD1HII7_SALDI
MALLATIIICIAITISQAAAASDGNFLEKRISNESQGKNSIELIMQQISLTIPYFSDKGEIRRMINNTCADRELTLDCKLALSAVRCCQELLPLAIDNLNSSLSTDVDKYAARSMVCAASSLLQTCVDGFEDQPRAVFGSVYNRVKYLIDRIGRSWRHQSDGRVEKASGASASAKRIVTEMAATVANHRM